MSTTWKPFEDMGHRTAGPLTFAEWVNFDDGNEAGMTIRDAIGDPETLSMMEVAYNEGANQHKMSRKTYNTLLDAALLLADMLKKDIDKVFPKKDYND